MLQRRFGCSAVLVIVATATGGCFDFGATSKPDGSVSPDGGSSFCATASAGLGMAGRDFFCDDFDNGAFASFWAIEQANGAASVDSLTRKSMPASMAAKSGAVPAATPVRAVAKLAFPAAEGDRVDINIQFDMYVDQFDTVAGAQITAFQLLDGPLDNFNQVAFNLNSTGAGVVAVVAENADGPQQADKGYQLHGPFPQAPAIKDWTHVEIDINILNPVGGNNTARVLFNGQSQYNGVLLLPLKGGQPRLEIGIAWAQTPAQAWGLRYDNFIVKLQ